MYSFSRANKVNPLRQWGFYAEPSEAVRIPPCFTEDT